MARDKNLFARLSTKNSGLFNGSETAASNAVCVPPGLYDVEVSVGAVTGSPTCALAVQDSADGASFAALADPRTRSLDNTKTVSDRFFLRGVRIVRWANGAANAGVIATYGGSGSFANLEIYFHPMGRAPQYNGTP